MAYRHSGRPGGLTATATVTSSPRRPSAPSRRPLRACFPTTPSGRAQFKKLHVYAGPEHPHAGQSPVPYELTQVAQ